MQSYAFAGDLEGVSNLSTSDSSITMNMVVRDPAGVVFKFEDFVYTENFDETEETINGRFYHPDYGYVDIVTESPFTFNLGAEFPHQGVLAVTGADDTSARLTAIDPTQYHLEVDLNGDGDYDDPEEDLGLFNWM